MISSVITILYGKPHLPWRWKQQVPPESGTFQWQCGLRSLRIKSSTSYHMGLPNVLSELEWYFPSKLLLPVFQITCTWRHNPEELDLNTHRWENLKAYSLKNFNLSDTIDKFWGLTFRKSVRTFQNSRLSGSFRMLLCLVVFNKLTKFQSLDYVERLLRFLVEVRNCSLLHSVKTSFVGPPSLLSSLYRRLFPQWKSSQVVKLTTVSTAEVKYGDAIPPLHVAWCLINYNDNFTFLLFMWSK
jgi:hypothetical protein